MPRILAAFPGGKNVFSRRSMSWRMDILLHVYFRAQKKKLFSFPHILTLIVHLTEQFSSQARMRVALHNLANAEAPGDVLRLWLEWYVFINTGPAGSACLCDAIQTTVEWLRGQAGYDQCPLRCSLGGGITYNKRDPKNAGTRKPPQCEDAERSSRGIFCVDDYLRTPNHRGESGAHHPNV